jgi:uncharacterized protein DUF420
MRPGFAGFTFTSSANLILLAEILMGVCLLTGAALARRKRYRDHAWCQSTVVVLNFVVIVATMIPSFRDHVASKIPEKLGRSFYLLATIHGVLGGIVELVALYVVLSAGTRLLPEKLRMNDYKTPMRTLLIFWWLVLVLGLATYSKWYGLIRF